MTRVCRVMVCWTALIDSLQMQVRFKHAVYDGLQGPVVVGKRDLSLRKIPPDGVSPAICEIGIELCFNGTVGA